MKPNTTTFTFDPNQGPVLAHKHPNGGGWVADTATVDPIAYVGSNAKVYDNAKVYGNAKVSGNAHVYGNAWVYGYALVYGDACINQGDITKDINIKEDPKPFKIDPLLTKPSKYHLY